MRRQSLLIASLILIVGLGGCVGPKGPAVESSAGPPTDLLPEFIWNVPENMTDIAFLLDVRIEPGADCTRQVILQGIGEGDDGLDVFMHMIQDGDPVVASLQRVQAAQVSTGDDSFELQYGKSWWMAGVPEGKTDGLQRFTILIGGWGYEKHAYDAYMEAQGRTMDRREHDVKISCERPAITASVEVATRFDRFQTSSDSSGRGAGTFYFEVNHPARWNFEPASENTFIALMVPKTLAAQIGTIRIDGPDGRTALSLPPDHELLLHAEARSGSGPFRIEVDRIAVGQKQGHGIMASFERGTDVFPGPMEPTG